MNIDVPCLVFPQVSDVQRQCLAFDLGFYPTRLFPIILTEGDVVHILTWLERLDSVSGTNVHERTAKFNGAHYGRVLESRASQGKGGEQRAHKE